MTSHLGRRKGEVVIFLHELFGLRRRFYAVGGVDLDPSPGAGDPLLRPPIRERIVVDDKLLLRDPGVVAQQEQRVLTERRVAPGSAHSVRRCERTHGAPWAVGGLCTTLTSTLHSLLVVAPAAKMDTLPVNNLNIVVGRGARFTNRYDRQ